MGKSRRNMENQRKVGNYRPKRNKAKVRASIKQNFPPTPPPKTHDWRRASVASSEAQTRKPKMSTLPKLSFRLQMRRRELYLTNVRKELWPEEQIPSIPVESVAGENQIRRFFCDIHSPPAFFARHRVGLGAVHQHLRRPPSSRTAPA